jgi:methylenetetrahydrofolate dehydrogenase (NADP+) / methenyltetrahydrofolate cyclohydrolase / formyltetrahydrofolate synthetase
MFWANFFSFATDTDPELQLVRDLCLEAGAHAAVVSNHWAEGGAGAADLGRAVIEACNASKKAGSPFNFLYPLEMSLKDKIFTICKEMYGAVGVEYTELAEQRLESYTSNGYSHLPICMAKTQYSLSTDAAAKGVPTGFTVTGKNCCICTYLSYSSTFDLFGGFRPPLLLLLLLHPCLK